MGFPLLRPVGNDHSDAKKTPPEDSLDHPRHEKSVLRSLSLSPLLLPPVSDLQQVGNDHCDTNKAFQRLNPPKEEIFLYHKSGSGNKTRVIKQPPWWIPDFHQTLFVGT